MYGTSKLSTNIAHNWAHELTSPYKKYTGQGSNFYYDGKTIYSYGRHFPIAVISKEDSNIVYFTTRSYSVTTSGHISTARQAVNHKTLIYCKNPDEADSGYHDNNVQDFEYIAKQAAKNLPRSRKPEIYLTQIAYQLERLETYCKHFKIDAKQYPLVWVYVKSKSGASEATEAEIQAIEAARIIKEKALKKQHAKELKEFRTFKRNRLSVHNGKDYLRFNPLSGRIETSQQIEIPTEAAKRFYKWLKATVKNGGCDGECKMQILHYEVTKVDANFFKIGCHTIEITEADKIAQLLKW